MAKLEIRLKEKARRMQNPPAEMYEILVDGRELPDLAEVSLALRGGEVPILRASIVMDDVEMELDAWMALRAFVVGDVPAEAEPTPAEELGGTGLPFERWDPPVKAVATEGLGRLSDQERADVIGYWLTRGRE